MSAVSKGFRASAGNSRAVVREATYKAEAVVPEEELRPVAYESSSHVFLCEFSFRDNDMTVTHDRFFISRRCVASAIILS